ncbi:SusC/RagA family TonB-linked outer membrane protein [Pontibacter silvestris]|uniref:SusC/RagA family TonB-linked outer membrane protein n=1 Tax=Pontibacter silvestris TaxID=2305183 RepID=A0ABW4WYR4_9BACT|nr:TonB-dependent receptor [Pontibacter silvestris]MCC9137585.1 TonB-dependent receptor [Pontibacter silvestris]
MRKLFLLAWLLYLCGTAYAQQTVRGRVTSEADGTGLPGVSIAVKGTSTGGITDVEGNYTVQAANDAVLVVSYIGFKTQEVPVNGRTQINITLATDQEMLDEVVVVGYGTQKKKLVTGATTQVEGEDIQKQSTTNALQALQGQAPGVQISSTSGQPGESMRVLIRGVGTVGNASPLYVVDGVLTDNIDYLNPADIASIDVLKDAASAAIYGSQAANGVVLITTRQGKSGQPAKVTFDTYFGVQNLGRKVDLLNSQQYASIMNEAAVNSGKLPYFTNDEIAAMGTGTDWIDEMFVDDAVTQNYSLGAQGGSENSNFSASLSYTSQEGIVGGKALSNYERYNARLNSEHKFYNDIITLGEHLTFAYIQSNGIGVGNQYNNSLRGAFNTSPFVPMYDEEGNFYDNSESSWFTGEANPYALAVYSNQNRRNNQRLLGDVYVVVEPIKNLRFRTSFGLNYAAGESRSYLPTYQLSIYALNTVTRASQSLNKGYNYNWDNLLSYNFNLNQDHGFEVMLGTSAYRNNGTNIYGSNTNLVLSGLDYAWLSNATNNDGGAITLTGGPYDQDRRMSYFGRLNYNYKETYLLNATFRADGSSRFAPANRWGYFPSVSTGWVLSNESFMASTQDWLSYFKLRASWGQVGNQNIDFYQYLTLVEIANTNYTFGDEEGALTAGAYPGRYGNENVKWETSEQTDIGFDARFLDGRLNATFDWYTKKTKDWLVRAPVPATAGAEPPFINGGNVTNKGIELALSYSDNIGDFNYTFGVNGSYNKNRVGQIPTADGVIHGDANQLFDNSAEFYRAENGHPIGYFWGLQTNGIFQSEEEVSSYRSTEGTVIQPNAQPGDLRYVDQNGDGVINTMDNTEIGNPNPDYTFGITLSGNYKAFDFSLLASGVAGNQIVQSYRNHSIYANYTTAILDRWHGPGSSNTMPRVTEDNRNWTTFSDLYIHDGDFLRISNITVGYDLGKLIQKNFISQLRVYASVQNLYTFTKYEGMDPEIGYTNSFASGIDLGYYPRPRTVMVGANIKF